MKNKPIIIIAGEPYSIFSEILFKSLDKNKFKNPIIIIGSYKLIKKQMKYLNYKQHFNLINLQNLDFNRMNNKKINIININFKFKKTFDKISDKSNFYIKRSFEVAFKIIKKHKIAGLINGPISKKNFLKKKFLGITEYIAAEFKIKDYAMLIYNSNISVCPVTTHLPLKKVSDKISKKLIINKVNLIKNFYKTKFNLNPSIAVTGLNPHCESNYKDSEEKKIITPAISELIKNTNISGPYAADSIFMKSNRRKFDVILGMYHDQVLTPMKTIYEFNAINITLGLPFIRISPDHGPNEKMQGKNISNHQSLIFAIKFLDQE